MCVSLYRYCYISAISHPNQVPHHFGKRSSLGHVTCHLVSVNARPKWTNISLEKYVSNACIRNYCLRECLGTIKVMKLLHGIMQVEGECFGTGRYYSMCCTRIYFRSLSSPCYEHIHRAVVVILTV